MTKNFTRKKRVVITSVKLGKGVLARDNKTPWAPSTFHITTSDGWKKPVDFSWRNLAIALANDTVVEIDVIDEDNNEIVIKLER